MIASAICCFLFHEVINQSAEIDLHLERPNLYIVIATIQKHKRTIRNYQNETLKCKFYFFFSYSS